MGVIAVLTILVIPLLVQTIDAWAHSSNDHTGNDT